MRSKSSDKSSEKVYSHPMKVEKENIICKDGFCSLPSKQENHSIKKDNINFFEPI